MADTVTALFGAIIMIGYMFLIAAKLAALPLSICVLIGVALMLWGFWGEDWQPLFKRNSK